MELTDLIPVDAIVFRLRAADATEAIGELSTTLARAHGLDRERIQALLLAREQLGSTALVEGLAAPHARTELPRPVGALGLSERGIDFAAPDGALVRIVVAVVAPPVGGRDLRALAAIARVFSDPAFREQLLTASSEREIYARLSSREAAVRSSRV